MLQQDVLKKCLAKDLEQYRRDKDIKICQDIGEHVYLELANHDKRSQEFMHVQVEKW